MAKAKKKTPCPCAACDHRHADRDYSITWTSQNVRTKEDVKDSAARTALQNKADREAVVELMLAAGYSYDGTRLPSEAS